MLVVSGTFRLPLEHVAEARPAMAAVIAKSRAEPGCRAYSYAEDVIEPGLFRVYEEWESREALDAHFEAEHMRAWQVTRQSLGFHDRAIAVRDAEATTPL